MHFCLKKCFTCNLANDTDTSTAGYTHMLPPSPPLPCCVPRVVPIALVTCSRIASLTILSSSCWSTGRPESTNNCKPASPRRGAAHRGRGGWQGERKRGGRGEEERKGRERPGSMRMELPLFNPLSSINSQKKQKPCTKV